MSARSSRRSVARSPTKVNRIDPRLARVTPETVYFDGLTFRREGPDAMTIFLALRDSGGSVREEVFRYRRQ